MPTASLLTAVDTAAPRRQQIEMAAVACKARLSWWTVANRLGLIGSLSRIAPFAPSRLVGTNDSACTAVKDRQVSMISSMSYLSLFCSCHPRASRTCFSAEVWFCGGCSLHSGPCMSCRLAVVLSASPKVVFVCVHHHRSADDRRWTAQLN